jgi:tRNA (guanosine-2'-O-)-methyltransferase
MKEERLNRIKTVVAKRQLDLTVVLENVHDPHNIGAVLRTCDSVGIPEIFVLNADPDLYTEKLEVGGKSTSGSRKWVDIHFYTNVESCFQKVKEKYFQIIGTSLTEEAKNLYEFDFCPPTAIVFGNEKNGISPETLSHCTSNLWIPQVGMVKSLNISVACAVVLYEAGRQRNFSPSSNSPEDLDQRDALLMDYIKRHESGLKRKISKRID